MNIIKKFKDYIQRDKSNAQILANVIGAFLVKGGALVVTLLTTPAYIKYFNNNSVLGLWYTLLSVISWILNFDLGIGNGLRNKLTEALSKNQNDEAHKYISSAYLSISVVVIVIIALSLISFNNVDWGKVFNLQENMVSSAALNFSVQIVFCGIMIQFLLRLVSSILYALQLSSVNNALSLVASIINLMYVSFATSGTNNTNLVTMALVHIMAVNIPLIITTLILFFGKLRDIRPMFRKYSWKYATSVLKLGGMFFVVQIAYMILVNTNEYFITLLWNSTAVVEYQIYFKLFTLIGTLVMLTMTPIWSAVTKAIAENRHTWLSSLYKRLLIFAGIGCAFEVSMIPFLQIIINLWLKENAIIVNHRYAAVFAIFGSLMILNSMLSSFANGTGKLKTQMLCFGIGSIAKIPISYILVGVLHSWIGIIIANTLALLVYVISQMIVFRFYLKNDSTADKGDTII